MSLLLGLPRGTLINFYLYLNITLISNNTCDWVIHIVWEGYIGCSMWGACREIKMLRFKHAIEPSKSQNLEAVCSTPIDEIHTWFAPSIKKWPTKDALEHSVNIMAACHMTCSLWVTCWGRRNSWSIEHGYLVYRLWFL